MRQRITEKLLAAVTVSGAYTDIHDTQPGLFARVYKGGRVTFFCKGHCRIDGKRYSDSLKLDATTPTAARKEATAALARITSGEVRRGRQGPVTPPPVERHKWQLGRVLTKYLKHVDLRENTAAEYQAIARRYFSDWDTVPLDSLTRWTLSDKYRELASKPATAAAAFRVFWALYRWAVGQGCPGTLTPACLPKGWNKRRRRVPGLFIRHVPALWRVFAELDTDRAGRPQSTGDFYRALLLTGQRFGTVAAISWADVSIEHRTLTIQRSKAVDEPTVLWLSDPLLEIFERRKAAGDERPFWNRRAGAAFDAHKISSTTKRICNRLADLCGESVAYSPHQLRKLTAGILNDHLAVPPSHVRWMLARAFSSGDIDQQHYASRTDVQVIRPTCDKLAAFILDAADA